MNVLKAIRKRRSVGDVTGDVSLDDVRTLVEAGLCAPNHKLSDPLHFTAISGSARAELGEVWGRAAAADRNVPDDKLEDAVKKEARKTQRAPMLLVVSVRTAEDPVRAEEDFATGAAATQNVLLAAEELGLASVWRTGDMVRSPAIIAHLGLAPSDRIVGIVYLGEPKDSPPKPPDRDVDGHLTLRS